MNLKNILWVRNTGEIVPNAPISDNLFGMKLSGGDVITTATGNPVSIVTNKAQNAISTILSYSPKQSGNGDPSPSNVRPIDGWTEANLNVAGKNLFDNTATIHQNITYGFFNVFPKDLADLTLSITDKDTSVDMSGISFGFSYGLTDGGAQSEINQGHRWIVNEGTKTNDSIGNTRSGKKMGQFAFYPNTQEVFDKIIQRYNVQIEIGSQATDYVPFITPTTTTISLGGTYYGFTVDVERGWLTVTHGIVDLGTIQGEWAKYEVAQGTLWRKHNIPNSNIKYNELNFICSGYKAVRSNNRTNLTVSCALNGYLDIINNDYSDSGSFKASLEGIMLAYPLATPIELPITPQTVALLAGTNTIWTDCGDSKLTYLAKK